MRFLAPFALFVGLFGAAVAPAQIPAPTPDSLLIVGISPATFEDGRETEINVTVAYDLSSADEAVLDLATNELKAQAFRPVAHARIKKGTGTAKLTAKTTPRYWTATNRSRIAVHLSVSDPETLRPRALAADMTDLPVARRARPESDPQNPNPSVAYDDAIAIKAISPESLVAGQETEIAVTVAYELFSREEGEINLGCNFGRGNGYRIIGRTEVKIGTGETVLRARLVPAATGKLPFTRISVNLSEFPHREKWSPLANDSQAVEVR